MASNLAQTVLQEIRTDYKNNFDKHEQRPSNYGALDLIRKQSKDPGSLVDADLVQKANEAFGRDIKVTVFDHQDVTLQSVRTCAIQTSGLTSKLIGISKVTYAFGIEMTPMQYYNNAIGYITDFQKQFYAKSLKLADTMDTASINLLEVEKNSFWPADMLAYYGQNGDTFQVANSEKEDLYNLIQSISRTQDFYAAPDILTNPRGMGTVRRLGAQGAGNSVNQAFQFAGYNWYESNRVTNRTVLADGVTATNVESTLYSVQPGSIGLITVADPQAKVGETAGPKEWYTVPNPVAGIPQMGVFYQADCADQSALQAGTGTGWMTQVKKESFQFSVDVYYIAGYNSNKATRYQPITKYEILG